MYALLTVVTLWVPVCTGWTLASTWRPNWGWRRRALAAALMAVAFDVLAARASGRLPSSPPQPPPDAFLTDNAWEAAAAALRALWPAGPAVRRLSVLGVLICAPLSGFGSVHLPHSLMDAFSEKIKENDVAELARRVADAESLAESAERRSAGSVARQRRATTTSDDAASLWRLHAMLAAELDDARQALRRWKRRGTLRGRLMNAAGVALAFVGIVRFFLALCKFLLARGPGRDLATRVADAIRVGGFVRHALSFAFVGFLTANSLRGFLKSLGKVQRALGGGGRATRAKQPAGKTQSSLFNLLLANLTGLYFLASLSLLRAKLPENARGNATVVLGMADAAGVALLHRWNDGLYVFGALGALGALYMEKQGERASVQDDGGAV